MGERRPQVVQEGMELALPAEQDLESRFCDWGVSLRFDDLRDEHVEAAQALLLDFVGCAIAGLDSRTSRISRSISPPGAEGVHIVGLPGRWPAPEAARQGAIAAHVLEMDDTASSASLHPGAVVLPAALAVGDAVGASGRDLLRAMAVGYELAIRLGEAVDPPQHYADGYHPTATCGVFGAAAAGALLLGADPVELRTALGFASTGSSGTLSYLNDGAPTKPIQVGNAAAYGTLAALLNHDGINGPGTVFAGRYGFFQAYAPHADADRLVKGLGEEPLRLLGTGIKPFACCRYVQPAAGLMLELVKDGLEASQVESIRIGVVTPALEIVGQPRERKVAPTSVPDAQFSLPFCAAVVLARGSLMPDDVATSIGDDEIEALAARVELVEDPGLNAAYPERWGGWVDVLTRDGRHIERATESAKGDPDNPLSRDELLEKAAGLVGRERALAIEAAVAELVDGDIPTFVNRISEEL